MDKDQQRIETYKQLEGPLQVLYDSPASGETMYRIFSSLLLPNEQYKAYAEIVGDTILGFNKIADMPRLFQQRMKVSTDESQRLTSKLIDFLAPVVKREELEANTKKEELSKLADTFSAPEGITKQQGIDPSAAENIQPIRTMEEDMHRVHGYGAYKAPQEEQEDAKITSQQDDILKK